MRLRFFVLTLSLGTLAAWFVERTDLPGRKVWAIVVVLPFAIPDFVVSFGWASLSTWVEGFRGAVLVMTLAVYPLVYLPVAASFRNADPGQEEVAIDLSIRILHLCVDHGGSITGEHGVGREKQQALGYMYSEPDLDTMQRVRCSFDPGNISNPDKVFPRPRLCGEKTGKYTPHPLETAGVAEFF